MAGNDSDQAVRDGLENTRRNSVLREAMQSLKTEVTLAGEICLDDSDPARPMLWSRGTGPEGESLIICWQAADPSAEKMKDMAADWSQFVVLDESGKPLGNARSFFLTR